MTRVRDLSQLAAHLLAAPHAGPRLIVAIAGAPASGKSTLAEQLAAHLTQQGKPAQVVPMDGFHLENDVLDARGLLPRKGAPETFDVQGFCALIERLHDGEAATYPVFDRQRDTSDADAGQIAPHTEILIIEGNYLLLDAPGWRDLHKFWDVSVALETPLDELRRRLIARWLDHAMPLEAATRRAEGNDIPNAERVVTGSAPADIVFATAPTDTAKRTQP